MYRHADSDWDRLKVFLDTLMRGLESQLPASLVADHELTQRLIPANLRKILDDPFEDRDAA